LVVEQESKMDAVRERKSVRGAMTDDGGRRTYCFGAGNNDNTLPTLIVSVLVLAVAFECLLIFSLDVFW